MSDLLQVSHSYGTGAQRDCLQSLDWTRRLDWWTPLVDCTGGVTLEIIFILSNETHSPVGWLHDVSHYPQNGVLLVQTDLMPSQ